MVGEVADDGGVEDGEVMAGEDPERDFNKKTVMAKPGLCPRGLRRRRSIPTDGFVNLNQIHVLFIN